MRKALLVSLLLIWTLLLPSGSVSAHSNLVGSDPANGSVLPVSPTQVTVEYSEAPDPNFSSFQIVDAATQKPLPSTFEVDPSRPEILHLHFASLKNGVYSAQWKVRSAVDGHVGTGSITFSIGQPQSPLSLLPPPDAPDPATVLPSWIEVYLRWLSYASLALGLGSLSFAVLVWRPAFRRAAVTGPVEAEPSQIFFRASLVGLISLGVFSLASLVYDAVQAGGNGGSQGILYLSSQTGMLTLARLILTAFLIFWVPRLPSPSAGPAAKWWVSIAVGVGILATFSFQSHLAASGAPYNVLVDLLHLGSMVAWMGGLVPLFLVIRALRLKKIAPVPLSILVPLFSRLALTSVTLLALTGLYTALFEIRTLEALTATTYGLAVLGKTGVFLLLFGLGAINLLFLSPRLAHLGTLAGQWLSRTVRIELFLGLAVLALAGVLTASNPAFEALKARQAQAYIASSVSGGVRMTFRAAPLQVGVNEFGVDLQDPRGAGVPSAQVLLRLHPPQFDLGVTQIDTVSQDNGLRYSARGAFFPAGGRWQVDVIVRRTGFDDIQHTFDVNVQGTAGIASEDDTPNPVPADARSLASGQSVYQQQCSSCHGASGAGNGPLATGLNPPPADLTQHAVVGIHPDGQLFDWITHGYPNSAMPAFAETLTDQQRWDLVNFIRTLVVKK